MTVELSQDGWDRTFLDLSSKTVEPVVWLYGLLRYRMVAPLDPTKFHHFENKITEVAFRIFVAMTALAGAIPILFTITVLGTTSKVLRAIGFALQKNHYTHVRGKAPEKKLDGEVKILTWNICGVGGGMHYDHGGVIDWRSRIDEIVKKIIDEDPDVITLQEVYDAALAEAIIKKLESHYAHFFIHLGANIMGMGSGEMVISKCAVYRFTNTSFTNNSWFLNRTFTTLDIKANPEDLAPCARVVGTHLIHDDNAKRMVQVAQIVDSVAREAIPLPTVMTGDLNLERDKAGEGRVLNTYLIHGYQGPEPTCTGRLVRQWNPQSREALDETIDYISLFKAHKGNAQLGPAHLVRAFDQRYNTKTALSDHHGLAATLRL